MRFTINQFISLILHRRVTSQFGKYTSDDTRDKDKENGAKTFIVSGAVNGRAPGVVHTLWRRKLDGEEGPWWGLQVKACGSNQTCFSEHAPHSEKNPRAKVG